MIFRRVSYIIVFQAQQHPIRAPGIDRRNQNERRLLFKAMQRTLEMERVNVDHQNEIRTQTGKLLAGSAQLEAGRLKNN